MSQKTDKKWLVALGAVLVVGGGLYYGLKSTAKPARIAVVNPQSMDYYSLKITDGGSGRLRKDGRVALHKGETYTFKLETTIPESDQVTGLEGKLAFDPTKVKVVAFSQNKKVLPVTLKKWTAKKLAKNKTEFSFAYGASLEVVNRKPEPPVYEERGKSSLNYHGNPNDPRYRRLRTSPGFVRVGLVTVKVQALANGVTKIDFPKDQLKLTTKKKQGNAFTAKGSKLSLVALIFSKPIPSPKPIITPRPTPKPTPKPIISMYDLNRDGRLNIIDYNLFLKSFGQKGQRIPADFNRDGVVDVIDYNNLLKAFWKGYPQAIQHHPGFEGGPVRAY